MFSAKLSKDLGKPLNTAVEKLGPMIMRMCPKGVILADTWDDSKISPAKDNTRNRESKKESSLPEGWANNPNIEIRIVRISMNIKW